MVQRRSPLSPTVCWWLCHPAAMTGVCVSARGVRPGGRGGPSVLLPCRVYDVKLLRSCSQAAVSCSQPEYSGLMSQTHVSPDD